MRMFFSSANYFKLLDSLVALGAKSYLFSYENKGVDKYIDYLKDKGEGFMILVDSGAFSAWNKGLELNIDEYCKFIDKVKALNSPHEIYFINIDVIPNIKGAGAPSKSRIDEACEEGLKNYRYIKERGHSTIHTFHMFDDFKYLDIIRHECNDLNYIGISPANDQSVKDRIAWLIDVYSIIQSSTRTHVLGLTAKESLELIPCFSADSSSWKNSNRFGHIFDYKDLVVRNKADLCNTNAMYYDFNKDYIEGMKYYINLESYATKLWEKRGIVW